MDEVFANLVKDFLYKLLKKHPKREWWKKYY